MRRLLQYILVVLSAFGVHNAICDEVLESRWRRSFQTVGFDHEPRGGRKCHDFCAMIQEMCRNGGTCVTDENTCIGKCVCAPGWAGQWCRDPFIPDDTQDLQHVKDVNTEHDLNEIFDTKMETTSVVDEIRHDMLRELRGDVFTLKPTSASTNSLHLSHPTTESLELSTSKQADDDRTVREECEKECLNGDCIKINGIHICKHRVNSTDQSVAKVCGPGFECDHGVCDQEALESNSYNCVCENNYVGQFCTVKCPYDCGEHGYCDVHVADNTYKCFCQWNYTGLNCSELVPEDPDEPSPEAVIFHWYVVGVSVTIVVVIVAALLVVAYLMWRQRLVFMLKIVHFFQQNEEDDGKEYDAFVSYKSCPRDEEFVLRKLFPKLEREYKFKLCMHFRDFIPGEAIANNIVSAIENSRRTIMILSPEYVQSEWCRMEYQKAQHEMLKLKHKIIPIVLADLSEVKNMDKNLKSIINSVTYLEWPGDTNCKQTDRFWKKLQLSLPKKPSHSSSSPSSDSSTDAFADTDSSSSELSPPSPLSPHVESISSIRPETDSPTPSSEETDDSNSPRFQKNKRKDLRHFMEKLIRTRMFSRQDSNSSQAALVDDETLASRSSCGSVSESMLSESSESLCSTFGVAHAFLDEINEDQQSNAFYPSASESDLRIIARHALHRSTSSRDFERRRSLGEIPKSTDLRKECSINSECEKDYCEGKECSNCATPYGNKKCSKERNSQEFINKGYQDQPEDRYECDDCIYMRTRSDNNRIRISAVDGSNKIRIQRLPYDLHECKCCDPVMQRTKSVRGNDKQHKDAKNLEIMIRKHTRIGSLPRNYKRSEVLTQKGTLNTRQLPAGTHTHIAGCRKNSCCIDVCENV